MIPFDVTSKLADGIIDCNVRHQIVHQLGFVENGVDLEADECLRQTVTPENLVI